MSLKIYHNQSIYTGGLNSPVITADVVLAPDAEALEKRCAELEKALRECEEQSCLQGPCWEEIGAIVKRALGGGE